MYFQYIRIIFKRKLVLPVFILAIAAFLVSINEHVLVNAQPSSLVQDSGVTITSPRDGEKVEVGHDMDVSGTSVDDSFKNCLVSTKTNNQDEYQLAKPEGSATSDYSTWRLN